MQTKSLKGRRKKSLPRRIAGGLANISLLVIIALFVYLFIANPVWMKGHSMEPAISQKSLMLINKMYYKFTDPQRLDIIAFKSENSSEIQIKRVIAVEGDTVQIEDGKIYINKKLCEEAMEYVHDLTSEGLAAKELTVGKDEYFVLGDHAAYSEDSRFYDIGMVKKAQVIGKVWFAAEALFTFSFY